ncbi:hypothetical protein MES5069_400187 [Mesorhizobium escarrei]|uniref:GDT1 family protein n=1 Tax=Mesorhizobium escarrei TaxID=666018 RepID=A0ABN8K1T9_9HYPH|nr:hypothetical protein MES5069_400187 [Mesorhizobium escarrei]
MTSLTAVFSTVTAAFLASFVEVVEAFTIVLAVGVTQSWRPALMGRARRWRFSPPWSLRWDRCSA